MIITYSKSNINTVTYTKLDRNKKNILLLGKSVDSNNRCEIINPVTRANALALFGKSDLYVAYSNAKKITNDHNIYCTNCYTMSDYLNIMSVISQYEFDFIVPIGINIDDKFYNSVSKKQEYFTDFFLNNFETTKSISTLVMTGIHADNYNDMESYLEILNSSITKFKKDSTSISKNGTNLIFTANCIKNVKYANVITAAILSINDSSVYPEPIECELCYDLLRSDIEGANEIIYFANNHITHKVTIENLVNFKTKSDIYKNVLINQLIKQIIKLIDLEEYKGRLYNSYVKLQIQNKLTKLLNLHINKLFKSYSINQIGFIKTGPAVGIIYVEISIVPYGSLEKVNIIMEV